MNSNKLFHKARRAAQGCKPASKLSDGKYYAYRRKELPETNSYLAAANVLREGKFKLSNTQAKTVTRLATWAADREEQIDTTLRAMADRREQFRFLTHTVKKSAALDFYSKVKKEVEIANGKCRERTMTVRECLNTIIAAASYNCSDHDNGGTISCNSYKYSWTTTYCSAVVNGDKVSISIGRGSPGQRSFEPEGFVVSRWLLAGLSSVACLPTDAIGVKRSRVVNLYNEEGKKTGVAINMPKELEQRFGSYEHGLNYSAARGEIERKRAIVEEEKKQAATTKREERKARLFAKLAKVGVMYEDIRAIGACDPGIQSWCRARNIPASSVVPLTTLAHDPVAYPYALKVAQKMLRELRA